MITAGDLVRKQFAPRAELLGPWLREGALAMVYAWRGVGKTWFALGVGHAVASAGKFLKWQAPMARKVAYFDGEMGEQELKDRILKVDDGAANSISADGIRFHTFEHCPDQIMWNLGEPAQQELYDEVAHGCDLIIIDNVSTCVRQRKGEGDKDSWLRVAQWAAKKRSERKAVLFVHHAGKTGTQRGASDREDLLDTSIRLSRPESIIPKEGTEFELRFEKTRGFFGKDAEPLVVDLINTEDGALAWAWAPLKERLDEEARERPRSNDGRMIW